MEIELRNKIISYISNIIKDNYYSEYVINYGPAFFFKLSNKNNIFEIYINSNDLTFKDIDKDKIYKSIERKLSRKELYND